MSTTLPTIHVGDIIKEGPFSARIIYLMADSVSVCVLDKSKLDIRMLVLSDVVKRIQDGSMTLVADDSNRIVDTSKLTDYEKNTYERNRQIIKELQTAYGPEYYRLMGKGSKPALENILSTYGLKRGALWNLIRKFLQSGCRYSSLVPDKRVRKSEITYKKKTGNPGKYGDRKSVV